MTNITDKQASFQHPSLLKRLAIVVYDYLLIIAVCIAYGIAYIAIGKLVFSMEADRPSGLFYQIGWLATVIGFYTYFWMKGGQTTGMRAWRVQITTLDGNPPLFSQCVIRFFVSPIGWLLCLSALFDNNKQCLHDKLSKTQLILLSKEKKKA